MRLWRISQWPGLDGDGGLHAAGRWNPPGLRVLYASEHPALALLEILVHLRLRLARGAVPTTLQLIAIDVADEATMSRTPKLPASWQSDEPATQAIGGRWLRSGRALVLPVPSALIAHATNYVVNPAHPQAATDLVEASIEPLPIDKRFLA